MNIIDKISVCVLGGFFVTALVFVFTHNFVISLFIGFLIMVLLRTLFLHFYNRVKRKKEISVAEMENAFSIMGQEQSDFLFERIPAAFAPQKVDYGILIKRKEQILICPNYKFAATNKDDVARFYRAAKKVKATYVYVLGRYPTRQVLVFGNGLDIFFRFVPSKKLHSFLCKQNALMPKMRKVSTRKRARIGEILTNAFDKKRAKYFALTGVCSVIFALISPYRVYYLIAGGVCLFFAVLCLMQRD